MSCYDGKSLSGLVEGNFDDLLVKDNTDLKGPTLMEGPVEMDETLVVTGNATSTGTVDATTFCVSGANCVTFLGNTDTYTAYWESTTTAGFVVPTITPTTTAASIFVSGRATVTKDFVIGDDYGFRFTPGDTTSSIHSF